MVNLGFAAHSTGHVGIVWLLGGDLYLKVTDTKVVREVGNVDNWSENVNINKRQTNRQTE